MAAKVAVVTGGTRGIGRGVVTRLADDHQAIAFTYRASEAEAVELSAELRDRGVEVLAIQADHSEDGGTGLIATVLERFGQVDSLINNAGGAPRRKLVELEREEWNAAIRLNLTTAFQLMHDALPGMLEREQGSIVNLGSPSAWRGGIMGVHYSASKAALRGLTTQAAFELQGTGVRVNLLEPVGIDTDLIRSVTDASNVNLTGGPRRGHPNEVGDVVAYLCSPAASYVSGAFLAVSGGFS
jgi:3-oxoacyl-[acyl-carrier protein] reductase